MFKGDISHLRDKYKIDVTVMSEKQSTLEYCFNKKNGKVKTLKYLYDEENRKILILLS